MLQEENGSSFQFSLVTGIGCGNIYGMLFVFSYVKGDIENLVMACSFLKASRYGPRNSAVSAFNVRYWTACFCYTHSALFATLCISINYIFLNKVKGKVWCVYCHLRSVGM